MPSRLNASTRYAIGRRATETAIPSFLSWSESPITFDQRDHPSCVARLGRYPLIVDPIVRKKCLAKVLMDGGSGLNILYIDTLDAMRIPDQSST